MSDEQSTAAPAETARDGPASEQTPLLANQPQPAEEQEPSTKRLLVIVFSMWLGVFLAALGMDYFPHLEHRHKLTMYRYDHCSYFIGPNLVLVQLSVPALLASNGLLDFQRSLSAAVWTSN